MNTKTDTRQKRRFKQRYSQKGSRLLGHRDNCSKRLLEACMSKDSSVIKNDTNHG